MSDPDCAALDPIFWLHHANIDRLWNKWLELGGARSNPTEAAWLNQSFVFVDETGAKVTLSCAEVVDRAAQLGYVFTVVIAAPWVALLIGDGPHAAGHRVGGPDAILVWPLMSVAMMAPLSLPALRHVGRNSIRARRQ